jgi:hypothetical protein
MICLTEDDANFRGVTNRELHHCDVCGTALNARGHWIFPILVWDGARKILICGRCCQWIKHGFMEDLIQIVATMELRDVRSFHRYDHRYGLTLRHDGTRCEVAPPPIKRDTTKPRNGADIIDSGNT